MKKKKKKDVFHSFLLRHFQNTRLYSLKSIWTAYYTFYTMFSSTESCCSAHKAREESEEGEQTEGKLSNFFKRADGGMTQQAMKISLIIVSYYRLSNSRIHCDDPLFHQPQERQPTSIRQQESSEET